jgi:hypothetical protein
MFNWKVFFEFLASSSRFLQFYFSNSFSSGMVFTFDPVWGENCSIYLIEPGSKDILDLIDAIGCLSLAKFFQDDFYNFPQTFKKGLILDGVLNFLSSPPNTPQTFLESA